MTRQTVQILDSQRETVHFDLAPGEYFADARWFDGVPAVEFHTPPLPVSVGSCSAGGASIGSTVTLPTTR